MGRSRYSCVIPPAAGDRQPTKFLAVVLDTAPIDETRTEKGRNIRLVRWHSQHWTAEHGRAGKIHLDTGTQPEAFWQLVRSGLLRPGALWLFCERAVQTMALLKLWEMVDDRTCHLSRRVVQNPVELPAQGAQEPEGLVCLEDPPTAFEASFPGFPGYLQVVDVANYAEPRSFGDAVPADQLQRLGAFIRAMVRILADRGLGSLQVTAGAQALYSLRRKHLSHAISTHCRPRTLALERQSAFGGRVECFRLGRIPGPVHQVDVTSFYPAICLSEPLPVALWHTGFGGTDRFEELLERRAPLCARVAVRTEVCHLPLRRDGITIYPVGSFTTTLAAPEFYAAWDRKEIRNVYEWASYRTAPALSSFAAETLEIRRLAKEWGVDLLGKWAKSLGVALVGKFLQEGRRWVDAPRVELSERWCVEGHCDGRGQWHTYRSVGGRVQRLERTQESRWSSPALSAWVLAHGRRRLWQLMESAGRQEVLYVNTDSLFLTEKGYSLLAQDNRVSEEGPGLPRLVSTWDWIELFGINHYRTPFKLVLAGQPPLPSGSGAGDGAVFRPRTAKEQIGARRVPSAEEVLVRVTRRQPYRHGAVGPGGVVTPWRLEE